MDLILNEVKEISDLIRKTPKTSKENIENYHFEIIKRLDSGNLISVPSVEHRNLHQQLWLVAFTIYNNYEGTNSAFADFTSKPTKDANGEYPSERLRFDIFYNSNYLKPYLENEKNEEKIKWAKDTNYKIMKDVEKDLKKSLEEVVVSLD